MIELGVNIDHVATLRQARRTYEPDPVWAAVEAELGGADAITVHLREDRRHINDRDVELLRKTVQCKLNLEMSLAPEIVDIALRTLPDQATLVPERRQEVTTEGGLDAAANLEAVRGAVDRLRDGGLFVSLFIDPDPRQIEAAHNAGAQQVELCTAAYAESTLGARAVHSEGRARAAAELQRLREAAALAAQYGLHVAAGHGLTYRNVGEVAAIPEITEFNIGHNVVSRAVLHGLADAVREMRARIREAKS